MKASERARYSVGNRGERRCFNVSTKLRTLSWRGPLVGWSRSAGRVREALSTASKLK